jgi:PAS domain S-box-containing protein
MLRRVKWWLQSPTFPGDEEKTTQARILHTVGAFFGLALLIAVIFYAPQLAGSLSTIWLAFSAMALAFALARYLLIRGRLELAGIVLVTSTWLLCSSLALVSGGIHSPIMFALAALTIAVGLLFGRHLRRLLLLVSILTGLALALLELRGLLPANSLVHSTFAVWFIFALSLLFIYWVINLSVRRLEAALAQSRRESQARAQAEQAQRLSEERFQMFMRHFPGLAYIKDDRGQILFANQGFQTYLGIDPASMPGKTNRDFFGDDFGENITRDDLRVLQTGLVAVLEEQFAGKTWATHKFRIQQGESAPLLGGVTMDISQRKQAEQNIRAALEEKETLLREIHHRVKNNLQVIIALIRMRSGKTSDPATRGFLQELEAQARSMSLVYEQLYLADNLSRVNMSTYLRQLITNVLDTYGRQVSLPVHIDAPHFLDVSTAMPCGLIVNELFTNILKHAFPADFQGQPMVEIKLSYSSTDNIHHLLVSDNGVGLPAGLDWQSEGSLGLRLVHLWATHQLGGSLQVSSAPGTRIEIQFSTKGSLST